MDSFSGKLAVVTGGGSGMGRELVRQLAAQGCSVAACDVNADAVAADRGPGPGGRAAGRPGQRHACDVSEEAQVLRFRDELLAAHAGITSTWSSATPASAAAAASSTTAGRTGSARSRWTGGASTTAPARSCRC